MDLIVEKYHALSAEKKKDFLKNLPKDIADNLWKYPDLKLFPKQIITGNDWRYYILLCGRAFGKSIASSAWLTKKILGGAKVVGVCVPVYNDLIQVMIPALQSWFPKSLKPTYNKIEHTLNYANGAICYCYSSEKHVRGPNLEYLVVDEVANFCDNIPEKIQETFDTLDFAVRAGNCPQTVITTTPKPYPIFKKWASLSLTDPDLYKLINGSMIDNPYIPNSYKNAMIKQFAGTRFGRQEIYGEIVDDIQGALWNRELIEQQRITPKEYSYKLNNKEIIIKRIIVAIDPAVTSDAKSDETGIIVGALSTNNRVYILEDASGRFTPHEWATKSVNLYDKYKADRIIAEKNNGGDLVGQNIKTVSRNVPIKLVHASRGKIARSEPVQSLYTEKRVYHVGAFPALEDQMCSFTGNIKDKSPDRLDALTWNVTELLLNNTTTVRDLGSIGYY